MLMLFIKVSSLEKYFFLRLLSVWCSLHHDFWGGVLIDLQLSSYFLIKCQQNFGPICSFSWLLCALECIQKHPSRYCYF